MRSSVGSPGGSALVMKLRIASSPEMVAKARLHWAFWLVSSATRLGITSRLHRATVWSALAMIVELGITSRRQGATDWSALARDCD